jgi:hypothetical protein
MDDALPFDLGLLEVDQKTQAEARGSQIIEALCRVLVGETVYALQFDHQYIFDEDIRKVFADALVLVSDGQRSLGGSPDAAKSEFPQQGVFVDFLEESGAKDIGNLKDCAQHLFSE